jgi:hypothetical protein
MIDDVADMDKRVRARIRRSYPPMTGVVRVKSKVTHFGDPTVANPFPFVFHIVLGKSESMHRSFIGLEKAYVQCRLTLLRALWLLSRQEFGG